MPDSREFFVGYLPVPPRQRQFLLRVVPALLVVSLLIGALLASSQTDPGAGVWDDGHERTWTGRVVALPYPHLQTPNAPGGLLLVVEMGKFGGGARLAKFDGQQVQVHGFLLARDARRMIELADRDDAIVPVTAAPAPALVRTSGETTELAGEIVDSKCYLGAMKPGDGVTHKACAQLCIEGGIPPVLVVNRDGARTYHLLTDRLGRPLGREILPFVGEPVLVKGIQGSLGGWQTLATDVEDGIAYR